MNLDVSLNAIPLDQIKIDKNLYEILGIDQNANHLTIKDAYIRQKQTFERNSLALYSSRTHKPIVSYLKKSITPTKY